MELAYEIANRLIEVEGVVGVCLGGSRALGTQRPDSDFDLGIYYRPPLDMVALRSLASELAGEPVEVTEPKGWGPKVNGGGWLVVGGSRIDWHFRDLGRVNQIWKQCQAGHYEVSVRASRPLGLYSHTYVGEVALSRFLTDSGGELKALQQQSLRYPTLLREALIVDAQWKVPFILSIARRGVDRGDSFYVSGCLFQSVGLIVQALHSHAKCWMLNEKGAVQAAEELPAAPANFSARTQALFGALGTTPDTLAAVLDEADRLVTEVREGLVR
ncbi:nucleotidyltransferase domain-containing protein [Streptomyces sp. NPDC054766]